MKLQAPFYSGSITKKWILGQEKKYAEAKQEYDEGIKRNPKEPAKPSIFQGWAHEITWVFLWGGMGRITWRT